MGEYAKYQGELVKIGTCEDMYYLRADQAGKVQAEEGNVDPQNAEHQAVIRFRFPWPDEDEIEPGDFEDYGRGIAVDGFEVGAGVEHHSVQFKSTSAEGYLVSLPCPESAESRAQQAYKVGRNGFPGGVFLVQQAYRGGYLVAILRCACGALFRVELQEAERLVVALRSMADKAGRPGATGYGAAFLHEVALRVSRGYTQAQQAQKSGGAEGASSGSSADVDPGEVSF